VAGECPVFSAIDRSIAESGASAARPPKSPYFFLA
jgi:hypothetical protein